MPRGGNKRGRPTKQEIATSRNVLLRWLTRTGNVARWHSENKNVLCREIVREMQARGMAHRKEGYVRSKIESMEKDYITAKKWLLETGLHDAYERDVATPEVEEQVDKMCGSYRQLAEAFRGVTFSTGATIELDQESSDEDDESDANDGGSEKNEAEANDEEAAGPTVAHKSASSDESSDESEEEEEEEEKAAGPQAMPPVARQAPSAADSEPTNGDMRVDTGDAGAEKPQVKDTAVAQAQEAPHNEPYEDDESDESDEEEEQEPEQEAEKQPEKAEEEEDEDDSESESDDSALPSGLGKPSDENAASPATQLEKSEPEASALSAPASVVPPPPVASAPTSSETAASNTAQVEHKAKLKETSAVSPPSPQKRRPGRARRTVAAKATPAPAPKKRVGRLTRSAPKVTTPSPKRKARDEPSPSVKRARSQAASIKSSSEASDIERDALLKRVEDERAQRLEMYEMDRAKLKCELEAKQVEVVCAKALARKKLLDAGIALAEVDRILPLGKRR